VGLEVEVRTLLAQEFVSLTAFSGAVGKATDTRSYAQNRKLAWRRMAESKEFKAWHKLECARRLGQLEEIEKIISEQLLDKNLKIEYI
jgi:hypothetical protein